MIIILDSNEEHVLEVHRYKKTIILDTHEDHVLEVHRSKEQLF